MALIGYLRRQASNFEVEEDAFEVALGDERGDD